MSEPAMIHGLSFVLEMLNLTIARGGKLRIWYRNTKGECSERVVEPKEVRGDTLFAMDVSKNEIRQFKTASVIRVEAECS